MIKSYALLNANDILIRVEDFEEGEAPQLSPAKGLRWELQSDAVRLEAAKEAKVQQIIGWVTTANASTFEYAGRLFSFEPANAQQILVVMGYVTKHNAFPATFPGGWKDVNRVPLQMATIEVFLEFYSAMINQGLSNVWTGEYLQAQVEECTTIDQLDAIEW